MVSTTSGISIEIDSFALAIGLGQEQKPACLILSEDSLQRGGEIAMSATHAGLNDSDLCLHSPLGSLVLKNVATALQEAIRTGVPFVVLNPNTQREHFIPGIGQ